MAALISADLALSQQKNKRKSIGLGTYTKKTRTWDLEIHIRELSLVLWRDCAGGWLLLKL
jgi:hypothetical protein